MSDGLIPQITPDYINYRYGSNQSDTPLTTQGYVNLTNWRNNESCKHTGIQNCGVKTAAAAGFILLTLVSTVETVVRFLILTFILKPLCMLSSDEDIKNFALKREIQFNCKMKSAGKVFVFSLGSLCGNCSSHLLLPGNFGKKKPNFITEKSIREERAKKEQSSDASKESHRSTEAPHSIVSDDDSNIFISH